MYYKINTVSSMMNEGDLFIIVKNDDGKLFFITTPSGTQVELYLKKSFKIINVGGKFSRISLKENHSLLPSTKLKNENEIREKNEIKTTNQNIERIYFKNLKCLNEVTIDFTSKNVTAIFGPNGSGKSTILHAMASLYQPEDSGENYRFIFFPRSPDAEWNGSHLEVTHSYRKGKDIFNNELDFYGKAEQKGSRWIKIYARRPFREIYYIGIGQCVPMIESEKNNNNVNYVTTNLQGNHANILLHKASDILNKRYNSINQHELKNGKTLFRKIISRPTFMF